MAEENGAQGPILSPPELTDSSATTFNKNGLAKVQIFLS